MRVFDFLPGSCSLSCSCCIHRRSWGYRNLPMWF